ncbi:MAG: hypothetical protein V4465_00325 [Patescibacteria group bacterium]
MKTGYNKKMKTKGFLLLILSLCVASFAHAQAIPGDVDLLWQGTGYTPSFYKGRDLWATQGQIVFTAIPHVSGGSVIYRWRKNGEVLGSVSGTGRNSLTLADSIFSKPITVGVEIVDANDSVLAERSVTLVPRAPKLLIYEDNPLYGLMTHHEVGASFVLREREVSFAAIPLFFSVHSRDSEFLKYSWTNNGSVLAQNGNRVTFRTPDGEGEAAIDVQVKNTNKIAQDTSDLFTVQFGSQEPNI